MMVKRLLELGRMIMSDDAWHEKVGRILHVQNSVDCKALASLIDECRIGLELFLDGTLSQIGNLDEIKALLDGIDGESAVKSMSTKDMEEIIQFLKSNRI